MQSNRLGTRLRFIRMLSTGALIALAMTLAAPAAALAHCADGMIHRVNALRAAHGLGPLHKSRSLDRSSERYSSWMLNNDYFGHRPRIHASRVFSPVGEVLSIHAGHSKSVGRTVTAWAASPAHAAVLLSPAFKLIGTGRTYGNFRGRSATVWTVHVGAS